MSVIDDYLSILNGDDNITFLHAEYESDVLKIATVYDKGTTHRLVFTMNGDIVIDKEYSSIMLVMKIVEDLMPSSFTYG